jgi:hypothetical protein
MTCFRAAGWTVALGVVVSAGCGAPPGTAPTVPVSGTATYKGQPLAGVVVTFNPQSGRPGFGTTDPQGKFAVSTFRTKDGAVPGDHKVTITEPPSNEPRPMPGSPEAKAAKAAKVASRFPAKYSSLKDTPLKTTVKEGNKYDFELTD